MSAPDFLEIFTGQLNKLNEVIKKKNEDYKAYNIFMINLNTSIGALAMSVKKLNNDLPSHLSKYGKDLEDSNRTISELQNKLAQNQSTLDQNNKEKQQLTAAMVDLNNQIIDLKSQINNLQTQIEQVKAESEMVKGEIKNQMAEATKAQKEELAKQLDEIKKQCNSEKEALQSEIQQAKSQLDSINRESGNVKSQLESLQKENNDLKSSNEKYINAITGASHTIGEVLNMLTNNPDLLKIPKKTKSYIDEIESYIVEINNQLMRPPSSDSSNSNNSSNMRQPTMRPNTVRSPPTSNINLPEVPNYKIDVNKGFNEEPNEGPNEGGRRRRRTKTKRFRIKKQKGGFIHSIFKKSRKSSYNKSYRK
jgi:chromosome segregation ATPase